MQINMQEKKAIKKSLTYITSHSAMRKKIEVMWDCECLLRVEICSLVKMALWNTELCRL